MIALLNAVLLASLLAFSHGLLKWLSQRQAHGYLQLLLEYWWVMGAAIGIYVFIFFYYAYVLRRVDLAVLYPAYTGLSIVLVFALGAWYFGEAVSAWQLLGCALIIGGIFLVSGAAG